MATAFTRRDRLAGSAATATPAEATSALDLQHNGARFVGQASQLVLRAMQDLARRQAEAVSAMLDELTRAPSDTAEGKGVKILLDAQQRYLRASVLGCLAQMQLGLDAAASTSTATLALLEEQLAGSSPGTASGDGTVAGTEP